VSRYREADFSRITLGSVSERRTKVNVSDFLGELSAELRVKDFLRILPRTEAALLLREAVDAIVASIRGSRPVVVMAGAHVIKTGVSPAVIELCRRGFVGLVALTGAGLIHDVEIALFGSTSEEVERELGRGSFGMVKETGDFICGAASAGEAREEGLGECVGRALVEARAPNKDKSLVATAYEKEIPVTIHVALGTDTIHFHPEFDGRTAGGLSHRDFRIFCSVVEGLEGGVVLNLGSAVVLPEVFLKALSVAFSKGFSLSGLTTISVDMQRQYRVQKNVLERPTSGRGRGIELLGRHEIMIPLLVAGVLGQI